MANNYSIAKRNLKWYQEDTEEPLESKSRMTEAYEPSRLKAGSDGKNTGCVTDNYASKSDRDFDDMGASKGKKTVKKTTVESKIKAKKPMQEEFDEDEMDFGDETEMGGDIDTDIEAEGDELMVDGGEGIVDDITITVGGQSYRLTPVADDMGGEDLGDGFDDELGDDMGIGAEEDDVTQPVMESKKKAVAKKVLTKAVESKALKLLKQKQMIEQQLSELFTGSYVDSSSGEKPTRAGDSNFAVTAKANSGKTYTPTKNVPTAFEPDPADVATKSKSPDHQTVKTTEARAQFKKWLMEQELAEAEDEGQTSVDFNKNDTEDNFIGDEFADMPLEVSGNDNQVSNYGESTKTQKGPKALKEALDFKKLMRGEY